MSSTTFITFPSESNTKSFSSCLLYTSNDVARIFASGFLRIQQSESSFLLIESKCVGSSLFVAEFADCIDEIAVGRRYEIRWVFHFRFTECGCGSVFFIESETIETFTVSRSVSTCLLYTSAEYPSDGWRLWHRTEQEYL